MLPFVLALQLSGVAPPPPQPPPVPAQLPYGFGRAQIGIGPPSFSPETSVLRLDGIDGPKVWLEIDGGYMPSLLMRHVGGGLWGAITYRAIAGTPSFFEVDTLAGAEIPIRFGSRALSLLAAPRAGVAAGRIDAGSSGAVTASGFVWGGQVSAVSSRYHLSASVSYLSARVGLPGIAPEHDLGGLYFSLGGLFDDV